MVKCYISNLVHLKKKKKITFPVRKKKNQKKNELSLRFQGNQQSLPEE